MTRLILGAALVALLAPSSLAQDDENRAKNLVRDFLRLAASTEDHARLEAAAREVVSEGQLAVEPLLEGIVERGTPGLVWSLRCLRNLGEAPSDGTLRQLLAHEAAAIRVETLHLLRTCPTRSARAAFLAATRDEDLDVLRRAYDGLRKETEIDDEILEAAVRGLVHDDFWITSRCIALLRKAPPPREVGRRKRDPVAEAAGEVVGKLRGAAAAQVFGLVGQRSPSAAEDLVEKALKQSRTEVRLAALQATQTLRLTDLAPKVRRLLRERDAKLRAGVARCLGALRDRDGVADLVGGLERESDPAAKEAIAVALRRITGQAHGYDTRAWRHWLASRR